MQTHHADTLRESVVSVLGAPPDTAQLQLRWISVVPGAESRGGHVKGQVNHGEWSDAS